MIKAMYTAASGMQAQQTEVDVIAHNLANVNTNGYKRSQTNFEDLLYLQLRAPGTPAGGQGSSMSGLEVGSGSRLVSTSKIFTPGTLAQTGRSLDVTINGDGFFELQGLEGERLFTRDGSFALDRDGTLVDHNGHKLEPEITIPTDAEAVSIGPTGRVTITVDGEQRSIGDITLVKFVNPAGLASEGGNIYAATENSGDPQTVIPGQEGSGELRQGWLERSNVDVATELISLIMAQRAYEVNSRAISSSDEMLSTANNITR